MLAVRLGNSKMVRKLIKVLIKTGLENINKKLGSGFNTVFHIAA